MQTFFPFLLVLLSSQLVSLTGTAKAQSRPLIVEMTRDDELYTGSGRLPPLLQLTKSGTLISGEGAPVDFSFFAYYAKQDKAFRDTDKRVVVILDVIDGKMPASELIAFTEKIRISLPKESTMRLILRIEHKVLPKK